MRIVKRVLSTYSADNFGFCSALYELGGLVVMHDASGCNSTCGGPLPHIIGTDFQAVAKAVWRRTGIPSFGLQTNGMDSYVRGAGGALAEIAELVKPPGRKRISLPGRIRINLLGVTPLDFSVNGSVREMEKYLEGQGFSVLSTWAMGNTLDRILSSADADVNLVVSACGLPAAKVLHRRFGIPFAVGVPAGRKNSREICAKLREAAKSGRPVGEDRMAEEPGLSGSEKQGGDGTGAVGRERGVAHIIGHGAKLIARVDAFGVEADAEYEVSYGVTKESGVNRVSFGENYRLQDFTVTMDTVFKGEDGVFTPYIWKFYKAMAQRNFEISQQSTGDPATITITLDVLRDSDGNFCDMIEDLDSAS